MVIQTFVPTELAPYVRGRKIPEVQVVDLYIQPEDVSLYAAFGPPVIGCTYPPSSSFADQISADPTKHIIVLPTRHTLNSVLEFYSSFNDSDSDLLVENVLRGEVNFCKALFKFYPISKGYIKSHETFHVGNSILNVRDNVLGEGLAIAYGYHVLMSEALNDVIDSATGFELVDSDIKFRTSSSGIHHDGFMRVLGQSFAISQDDVKDKNRLESLINNLDEVILEEIGKISD